MQDPPEYYDPPGGLMSFDLNIQDLLPNAAPKKFNGQLEDFEGHFTLVNHELIQVMFLNCQCHPADRYNGHTGLHDSFEPHLIWAPTVFLLGCHMLSATSYLSMCLRHMQAAV